MSSYTAAEILSAILVSLLLIWYAYYQYCFRYWKRKGVPGSPPSFPAGNITWSILGKESLFTDVQKLFGEFKEKGFKHAGVYFFNGPVYLPIDPEIIKSILVTDFEHFVDRGTFADEEKFPLTGHLFSLSGAKWKQLRAKLSPTFTSGKLKTMFPIFMKNAENFVAAVEPEAAVGAEVNIKKVAMSFFADTIGSVAFGLDCNTLQNPTNEMAVILDQVFNPPIKLLVKTLITEGFQNPGNIVKVIHSQRNVEYFFKNLVEDAISYRDHKKIIRNDFMSLMLEIRDKVGLSFNEILAQTFLFFLAGFETSSATLSYCIHELAHHQDIQDKLRAEIRACVGEDFTKLSYDDIQQLPYLDQVFKETLRIYPVLGFLNRICVKKYKVPGTDVILDEGTPVVISTLGLQRNPAYFPDPLKFDPERFRGNSTYNPFTFLPFGDGPRFCIGKRLGQMQTKLGISVLISQYKFFPSEVTPRHIEFDRPSLTLAMSPRKGLNVKIVKI